MTIHSIPYLSFGNNFLSEHGKQTTASWILLEAEGRGIKVSHKLLVNLVKYWLFCRLRKLWLPFVFHILNIFCDLKHSLLPFAVKEMKETHFSSTCLNALISSYCYKYVVVRFSQCPINQDPWPELDLCPVKKQSLPQVILWILQ